MGFFFDTVITVTASSDQDTLDGALSLCGKYEKLLSKTIEGSDVWQINHASGATVQVSADTIALLKKSIEISEASGGAFDITVAPAIALWDFTGDKHILPDKDALAEAATLIDYRKISIEGNYVTLGEGIEVDLGGIAKGYIADKIAEYLWEQGVESGLLNFGGNVLVIGTKPGGEKWSVGVRDPDGEADDYIAAIHVANQAVVTSGVYERGFALDGVWYHHILDTKTGWPVHNGLMSVTIVADNSTLADALSTTCFALGIEEGTKLAEAYAAQAVFIDENGMITASQGLEGTGAFEVLK